MKIEELQIGDYVNLTTSLSSTPCIIEELGKRGWVHVTYANEPDCRIAVNNDYLLDCLSDIKVTPSILDQLGFYQERNVGYVLDYDDYEIIYDTWDHNLRINKYHKTILDVDFFDDVSVRELQHYFRLLGIEYEIKLTNTENNG